MAESSMPKRSRQDDSAAEELLEERFTNGNENNQHPHQQQFQFEWQEWLFKLGTMEGEAQPIAPCQRGTVFRKKIGRWDLAIKTLYSDNFFNHEQTKYELSRYFNNETSFYIENPDLQGLVIPRFWGSYTLELGTCLVTEYIGPALSMLEEISQEQSESALAGLLALHQKGVLLGDARLCNVVWSETLRRAFWVDLTFCSTHLEGRYNEAEWKTLMEEEYNQLKISLEVNKKNSLVDNKPHICAEIKI